MKRHVKCVNAGCCISQHGFKSSRKVPQCPVCRTKVKGLG